MITKKYDYVHELDSATWQTKSEFRRVTKRILRKLARQSYLIGLIDGRTMPFNNEMDKKMSVQLAKDLIP